MSCSRECTVVAKEQNVYYILQDTSFRSYSAHGPFKSQDEALNHLHNNYSNPGGYTTQSYTGLSIEFKNMIDHVCPNCKGTAKVFKPGDYFTRQCPNCKHPKYDFSTGKI